MGNCFQGNSGSNNNGKNKNDGNDETNNQLTGGTDSKDNSSENDHKSINANNNGNNNKKNTKRENKANSKIDDMNKKQQSELTSKTHRVLLLGPGDSGKTTILNQMRKIHGVIRTEHSMDMVISVIRRNIVKYMAVLCVKTSELGIEVKKEESIQHARNVVEYAMAKENNPGNTKYIDLNRGYNSHDVSEIYNPKTPLTQNTDNSDMSPSLQNSMCPNNILESIKFLWNEEPAIKETLLNRSKFQIDDNVGYFFNSIDRCFDSNFDPIDDDILRLRMRTSGFQESVFNVYFDKNNLATANPQNPITNMTNDDNKNNSNDGNENGARDNNNNNNNSSVLITPPNIHDSNINRKDLLEQTFVFIDVGGQRSERKKWMQIMTQEKSIEAVLYVVAIAEYDLTCFEDSTMMRLNEALELFKKCANNGILEEKTITIFFNKYDLFLEKIEMIKKQNENHNKNDSNDNYSSDQDQQHLNIIHNFRYYYHDYADDPLNPDAIVDYVFEKFRRAYLRNKYKIEDSRTATHPVSVHIINSTNNTNLNANGIGNGNSNGNGNGNDKNSHSNNNNHISNSNNNSLDNINLRKATMELGSATGEDAESTVIGDYPTDEQLPLYMHHTCALDTKQISKLMLDIQLSLISKQLETSGFMWSSDSMGVNF